jgi:hypothetical protein
LQQFRSEPDSEKIINIVPNAEMVYYKHMEEAVHGVSLEKAKYDRSYGDRLLRLNAHQRAQFGRLKLEYESLDRAGVDPQVRLMLDRLFAKPKADLIMADYEAAEVGLFQCRPPQMVQSQISSVAVRFREANPALPTDFLDCFTGQEEPDVEKLRNAATVAVREVHRVASGRVIQDRKRRELLWRTAYGAILLTSLFIFFYTREWNNIPTQLAKYLTLTVSLGALGGLMSAFVSISSLQPVDQATKGVDAIDTAKLGVVVATVSGFVFSMVMFQMLEGKLLSGSFFPSMQNLYLLSDGTVAPTYAEDLAKLMVWSFAAGYIGSLVPGLLQKTVGRIEATQAAK